MGHTVRSQRRLVDDIIAELSEYGKALSEEDKVIFNKLMKKIYKHVGAISYTSSYHAWSFMLISLILEQEKELERINKHLSCDQSSL